MSDTSPERTLNDAIVAHLRDLRGKREWSTVKTYASKLRIFTRYCPASTPLSDLTPDVFARFPAWLARQDYEKSTRDNCLAAVWSFVRYLFRHQLITMDAAGHERVQYEFAETRRKRASIKSLPEIPSRQAIDAAIEAARAVSKPDPESRDAKRYELQRLRDIALLEMMRATGLRVGEVVALTRGSLDYERQMVRVTITKSKKGRVVPVDKTAWEAVTLYLKARDGDAGPTKRGLPLFAGHARKSGSHPQPITTRTVQMRVRAFVQAAGVEEELTPHGFRHRLATDLVRATHDLEATRKVLGHEDIKTTQRYTHLVDEDVEQAMVQLAEMNGNGEETDD